MSEQLEFSALFSKTKVTSSFDTPEMTTDAGVLLLREIDKITGISDKLANAIHDQRTPGYVTHSMKSLIQQRIYQICQGYEDADDCDHLRKDAALKTAVEKHSGHKKSDLCPQPTMTRLENSVTTRDLIRLFYAQIDLFCETFSSEPTSIVLDVDPTVSYCYIDYRYIVTSCAGTKAKYLYESVYCDRGNAELCIKEHKNGLQSDRTSCHKATANQFRLFLHTAAYTLMHALRKNLLHGTELQNSSFETIRIRLLKVAAVISVKKTRLHFHMPMHFPLQNIYQLMLERLKLCRR